MPRSWHFGDRMTFPYVTETVIGISTIVAIIGSILYFKMGSKPAKIADKKKEGDSTGVRERSYSNLEEKYPAGKMCIYFGSQTGTAEGFARIVLGEGQKHGFEARIHDLEDFEPEQLQSCRLAIFLLATYGEGDPTDNSAKFVEWLNSEDVDSDFLSSVDFSVFGLGNTQYENYNKIGRSVNQLLEKVGGTRVVEYGEGDDDATLEDDFENWKKRAIPALVKKYHPDAANTVADDVVSKVNLTFKCTECEPADAVIPPAHIMNTSTKYFFSSPESVVITNREMRSPQDGGSTVHVEFDISGTGVKYQTADNLAVIPNNSADIVNAFAKSCGGFDLGQYVNLEAFFGDDDVEEMEEEDREVFKHPFPSPCSIHDIFAKYLDIASIPRKSVLERFLPYLTDKAEQTWLADLVKARETYQSSIETEGRTFCSLLCKELSSCRIPLADLLHIIPLIQPRYYTICSSSSVHPDSIHLTVALSERRPPSGGDMVYGLCSRFLQQMEPTGSRCRIFCRDSLFRLPVDLRTPVIMIGPGSGVAPMRALLQERKFQADKEGVRYADMTNILYFGCKSRELDFLYKDELMAAVDEGHLTSLKLAFSREQKDKVYVQTLMQDEENAKELCRLVLEEEAHVFVCGGTLMGASVHDAFVQIVSTHGGMSVEKASELIKAKQKNKVYKQELWSV